MQRNRTTESPERNKTNSQKPFLKQHRYWYLVDENFKIAVLNMSKELKENRYKELMEIRGENVRTKQKYQQRDRNCKKKPNKNSGTKKYNN